MKCAKCGAELKEGCLYCSICGHEAQIVNGYSTLEDEYLSTILTVENNKYMDKKKKEEVLEKASSSSRAKNQKKMYAFIVTICVVLLGAIIGSIAFVQYQNNNSYDYQVKMAEEELIDKNYEKALEHYEKALEITPKDIPVRLAMASICEAQGKTDEAMVLYMDVIHLSPENVVAYEKLIALYDKDGQYDKVIELSNGVESKSVMALFDDYLVSEPVVYPDEGFYASYVTVTMLSMEECDIYYTLDGTEPDKENGILYDEDEGIELESQGTFEINAVCINEKGICSNVIERQYRVRPKAPQTAVILPNGGTYDEQIYVTLEAEENCNIYYTWDGTDPTKESYLYVEPFPIPEGNNTLSVLVIDNRTELQSQVKRTNFICELPE